MFKLILALQYQQMGLSFVEGRGSGLGGGGGGGRRGELGLAEGGGQLKGGYRRREIGVPGEILSAPIKKSVSHATGERYSHPARVFGTLDIHWQAVVARSWVMCLWCSGERSCACGAETRGHVSVV